MSFLQSISANIIVPILGLLIIFILAEVIFSWLLAFNIINLRNPVVAQIYDIVRRLTHPILEPFRKFIPAIGGLDLSPIAAIILLGWMQSLFSYGGPVYRMLG